MSLTKDQANADSAAALAAIVAAENTLFIADVDAQILEAIDQGKYWVDSIAYGHIDAQVVFQHYIDLGYAVSFPDFPPQDFSRQPTLLFGQAWIDFWNNTWNSMWNSLNPTMWDQNRPKKPLRFLITWLP